MYTQLSTAGNRVHGRGRQATSTDHEDDDQHADRNGHEKHAAFSLLEFAHLVYVRRFLKLNMRRVCANRGVGGVMGIASVGIEFGRLMPRRLRAGRGLDCSTDMRCVDSRCARPCAHPGTHVAHRQQQDALRETSDE